MRLSNFIIDLGRVIAYYPKLKNVTNSTTASILLCQLLYWSDKTKDDKGWIYKDSMELEDETGLTYYEQTTARQVLINLGILQEQYKRLDHKIAFFVNVNRLNDLWEESQGRGEQEVTLSAPPLSATSTPYPEQNTKNLPVQKPVELTDFQDPKLHPEHPAHNSAMEKKGDLVDGILFYSQSPGMKKETLKNEIRDKIENLLHINTETPKWDKFIEFAYQRQVNHNEPIDQWIRWAIKNNFNPIYWTPEKCKTTYPQAFIEDTRNKPREDFVEKLPEIEEEEYAPMPEEAKTKKKLY